MRLIDADKLHPDRMTNKGTVAISQSQIANAKTVEAVPLSVIEKIKAEIIQYFMQNKDSEDLFLAGCGDGAYHALAIIDEAVKECTHEV